MVNCENDEVRRSCSTYEALNEREMPSIVKYGSVCATLNTWLYLPPLRSTRQPVAGAEQVAVDEVAAEHERLALGVADAAAELRRRALFDRHIDVDEIGGARDRLRLGLHLLDVWQALQTLLRARHRGIRQHRAFELAHLAAQDLVARALDALES